MAEGGRNPRRWFVPACLVWGCAAWGQEPLDHLPVSLLTDPGPLTGVQIQSIDLYVVYWSGVLCGGGGGELMREARLRLLEPITDPAASAAVSDAASRSALTAVRGCLGGRDDAAKLNAMIVAAAAGGPGVAELCVIGLNDRAAGVRLWAARTLVQAAARVPADVALFNIPQQQRLLAALRLAMARETEGAALEEMFSALSTLQIVEARSSLLDILSDRVTLYTGQVSDGLRADRRALEETQNRLAIEIGAGRNVDSQLRRLTSVTARYVRALVADIHEGRVPEDLLPAAGTLLETAEKLFGFVMMHYGVTEAAGPPLVEPFRRNELDELYLNALEWIGVDGSPGLLSTTAVNIPFQLLR